MTSNGPGNDSEDLDLDPDFPPPPDDNDQSLDITSEVHNSGLLYGITTSEVESTFYTSSAPSDFDFNINPDSDSGSDGNADRSGQSSRKRKQRHQTGDRIIASQGIDSDIEPSLQENLRAHQNQPIIYYGRKR